MNLLKQSTLKKKGLPITEGHPSSREGKVSRYALSKFMQALVKQGKKNKAENLIYKFFLLMDKRKPWESSVSHHTPDQSKERGGVSENYITPLGDSSGLPGRHAGFIWTCINQSRPVMEFKAGKSGMFSRRGSAVAVTTVRGVQVGIKWIIEGAQKRPEKTFQEKLYKELLSVSENQGYASKKKHSWYVLCQKAFLKAIKD